MPNEVELHNLRKAHHESIRTREEFQTRGGNYRYWKALIVVTAIVAASAVILGAFAIREVSRMVNPIQVPVRKKIHRLTNLLQNIKFWFNFLYEISLKAELITCIVRSTTTI